MKIRPVVAELSHVEGHRDMTKQIDAVFYCCTVHFDKVQNSFHQQMHTLLNI
jgi:hypothetical protein